MIRRRPGPSPRGDADADARPSVFLSYASPDHDAARLLEAHLASTRHDVWLFPGRTRPGGDWHRTMLDELVARDVVVFLASEASFASEYCRIEMRSARDWGKRLLVVALGPRLEDVLPTELDFLRTLQWCRWDGHSAVPPEVGEGVDQDPQRLAALTHLDRRALDWDRLERRGSALLHGADLVEAVRLVSSADQSVPSAGESVSRVARTYVDEGLAARTRLRRVLAVTAVLTVVALVATGLVVARTRAGAELAERGKTAQAWRGEAADMRTAYPAEALRRLVDAHALDPSPASRALVAREVMGGRLRRVLGEPGNSVRSLTYDRDGSVLATAGTDGVLRTYRSDAVVPDSSTRLGVLCSGVVAGPYRLTVAVDDQLVTMGTDNQVRQVGTTPVTGAHLAAGASSADGRLLASGGLTDTVPLFSVSGNGPPTPVGAIRGLSGEITHVTLAPSGRLAAAVEHASVVLWDVTAPAAPREVAVLPSAGVAAVAFSPDEQSLAVAAGTGVRVVPLAQPRQPTRTIERTSPISGVAFSPDASGVLALVDARGAALYPPDGPSSELPGGGTIPAVLAFRPDGRYLAVGGTDGSVFEWSVQVRGLPDLVASAASDGEIREARPDDRDGTVAVVTDRHSASVVGLVPGARSFEVTAPGPRLPSSVARTETALAIGGFDGKIDILDPVVPNPRSARSTAMPQDFPAESLEFDRSGSLLTAANGQGPGFVWRVAPGELVPVGALEADYGPAPVVRARPDGRRIGVGGRDGKVVLYDVVGGAVVRSGVVLSDAGENPVSALEWLPDGSTLAVASETGVRLVNVGNGGATAETARLEGVALELRSPPGSPLLIVRDRERLALWDVADPTIPQPLGSWGVGTSDDVVSAFSPSARWLADATLSTWTVRDLDQPLRIASDPVGAACLAVARVPVPADHTGPLSAVDSPRC